MLLVAVALVQPAAAAQTTTATLTGTVLDASGALVADATVTLKNETSGDTRSTVSNSDGFFVFAAVPPTSYTVIVERAGFKIWQAKGVVLNSADKRNLIGISLMPGMKTETVVVEAADTSITPVDSGEKSALITQHVLENVAIVGQNAAEFVKILPGMSFQSQGIANTPSYAADDQRTGTGPVGQFSANGTRTAALDITSDGAHIIDPGCNCGQAMNTNADMTAELKVMTSNFGADEAKGPVTISVIGKAGGQRFHGEAYLYARHFALNANDPQDKNGNIARPESKYWYPGFQFSGPVLFPHSGFNRNRDKMFFFFATEAYRQDVDNGVYHAVVPTAAMRQGESPASMSGDMSAVLGHGSDVPAIVFHGDQDNTVHPRNGDHVIAQRRTAKLQKKIHRGRAPGGHAYTRTIHTDASGRAMFEHWEIHGAGHAWSGGSPAGSYTDPRGPDAAREMLRFFLEHPSPRPRREGR